MTVQKTEILRRRKIYRNSNLAAKNKKNVFLRSIKLGSRKHKKRFSPQCKIWRQKTEIMFFSAAAENTYIIYIFPPH